MIRNWKSLIISNYIITYTIGFLVICRLQFCGERVVPIVHDWSQPREIFTLTGHTDEVTHAIYSPDG
ncbi:MAG: hypothetical protein KAW56_08630, partial [Candidatus Marinimicrobia bacterium]|nr:hypothetical protein [Candidatus Neomarinimicrobiota bacterium]